VNLSNDIAATIACPRHRTTLREERNRLICPRGDSFPLVGGVPVFLAHDVPATHPVFHRSLELAAHPELVPSIDPIEFVTDQLTGTCGHLYRGITRLDRFPIPKFPDLGRTGLMLDIGSNWGRWCLAAAAVGNRVVGLDPALEAVLAGQLIADEEGHEIDFVVGDARELPFEDETFDIVFSYSVLQHFSETDVATVLADVCRVLKPDGIALIQMANWRALRQTINRLRGRTKESAGSFRVRQWRIHDLVELFTAAIGPTEVSPDSYFSLNARLEDMSMLRWRYRPVVYASWAVSGLAGKLVSLRSFADSIWIRSRKP